MHVCLFDVDGTLLHAAGAGRAAMEFALSTALGITVPTPDFPTAGRTDRAIIEEVFNHHKLRVDRELFERYRAVYIRELRQQLAVRLTRVYPGVPELLQQLRNRGDVRLGLLTGNFRDAAWIKLKHFGLDEFFCFGGFGDEHCNRDAVAQVALTQARQCHPGPLSRERVWVLGDTPADVRCGRAIGCRVIAVATGASSFAELSAAEPDHLFADFSNPTDVVALLNG
jgi:phosphoglycolate phosphatase